MLLNTKSIVLRQVKYGETSLIITLFTEAFGMQSYMLKGIRNDKSKRAGLLQIGSLLDIVAEHKPNRQLQHLKEFRPSYLYDSLHEEVIKNAIAIYSVELLQKLLPKEEEMQSLFLFTESFFKSLDTLQLNFIANYPLYFTIQCGKFFGYNINGAYSATTPYLDVQNGIFVSQPPSNSSILYKEDVPALSAIIQTEHLEEVHQISLNAATRGRMLDWYIQFLQHHTQHLANLKSLAILKTILH
jgi:DNA repair protein RecO (recombination protein O)